MADETYVDATFYVQLAPEWMLSNHDNPKALRAAKFAGGTITRPTRPKGGSVTVKLTVRVPRAAFIPLRPEAVIVVPEGMTFTAPIEVEAIDPNEPQEES